MGLRRVSEDMSESISSPWWYGVAVIPVYAIGLPVLATITTPSGGAGTNAPIVGVIGAVVVLGIYVVSPLFPLSLYFDARNVRDADVDWNPSPALYAGLGLAQLAAPPITYNGFGVSAWWILPFTVPLALIYLYQRHRGESIVRSSSVLSKYAG
jgi:hypothetical protein